MAPCGGRNDCVAPRCCQGETRVRADTLTPVSVLEKPLPHNAIPMASSASLPPGPPLSARCTGRAPSRRLVTDPVVHVSIDGHLRFRQEFFRQRPGHRVAGRPGNDDKSAAKRCSGLSRGPTGMSADFAALGRVAERGGTGPIFRHEIQRLFRFRRRRHVAPALLNERARNATRPKVNFNEA